MRRALGPIAALTFVAALATPAFARPPQPVTIDFSSAPLARDGLSFPKDFYEDQGIVFTESGDVGFTQGDDTLDGGPVIAARFTVPITRLSLEAAPGYQGTAEYTLTALDQGGRTVASRAVVVTEDEGDPANQGFGFFDVDLGTLPRPASAFTLRLRFIRRSYGPVICSPPGPPETCFTFGVRKITFTPGPTRRRQCRRRDWRDFGVFESRRDCLRFVATSGGRPAAV